MPVTASQIEEFKRRKAEGSKISDTEVEEFNRTGVKLTKEQYEAFLEATEEKLK